MATDLSPVGPTHASSLSSSMTDTLSSSVFCTMMEKICDLSAATSTKSLKAAPKQHSAEDMMACLRRALQPRARRRYLVLVAAALLVSYHHVSGPPADV